MFISLDDVKLALWAMLRLSQLEPTCLRRIMEELAALADSEAPSAHNTEVLISDSDNHLAFWQVVVPLAVEWCKAESEEDQNPIFVKMCAELYQIEEEPKCELSLEKLSCAVCRQSGEGKLFRCTGCLSVIYCSSKCQKG